VVLIPLGIVALVAVLVGMAAGLAWTPVTVGLAIVAFGVVLLFLINVISFVSVPPMVFFQAYTLEFFGSRYLLLGEQLARTSPTPKLAPIVPPGAAPLPAS
jgi:hypothetical protein